MGNVIRINGRFYGRNLVMFYRNSHEIKLDRYTIVSFTTVFRFMIDKDKTQQIRRKQHQNF